MVTIAEACAEEGVDAVILSSIPSVARETGYWPRWEMWPGASPHTLDPTLAVAGPGRETVLLLPSYYSPYAGTVRCPVETVPSYSYLEPIDKLAQLTEALARILGPRVGRLGYEARTLTVAVRDALGARIRVDEWVDVESRLESTRLTKTEDEIAGIRRAAMIADQIQAVVKQCAEPGRTEVDVVGDALSAAWSTIGRRFPILIQLKTGPSSAVRGDWHPRDTVIREGDVICTDTAPWLDGLWADSCNGIAIGEPTSMHLELFAVANAALRAGIEATRSGVPAAEVDQACRAVVRSAGYDYPHHTGHGIGYMRAEPPRITPTSSDVLESGMVIALEPGVYVEGFGGFRNEHIMVVCEQGAELLTRFEHTL